MIMTPRLRWLLVVLMCGTQVADALSTLRAFGRGAVELNPLIGQDAGRVVLFKSLACLVCCWLVLRTSRVRPETQWRRCLLYAGLFVVVVASNWTN